MGLVSAVDAAGLTGYLVFRAACADVALPQLVAEAMFELIYIDSA
jgi:hypothetical protein